VGSEDSKETIVPMGGFFEFVEEHFEWSKKSFGSTKRTLGIIRHIEKELKEVEADPDDLFEWIDVIILGIDGFCRHGGKPRELLAYLWSKFYRNRLRTYPFPTSDDEPSEHLRTVEELESKT
jgi:hypothetical protein